MNDDSDFLGLRGRVCVVTGSGSGIGRGIALAFARVGARVAVLDLNAEGTEATREEIVRLGGEAVAIGCDTSDEAGVAEAAERSAKALGPCDVLVNNAGVLRSGSLDTLPLALWNQVLAVNLTGYFLCSQVFGAQMRAKGKGAIVHIASISSAEATAFAGAYGTAKAGVRMLSHQLAVEWGPHGIRSNAVHPGMIMTPMVKSVYDQAGVEKRRSESIPLGRIGQPDDIAQAVLFLASDRAAYITGDDVTVDGGFTRMLMSLVPRAGYERPAN